MTPCEADVEITVHLFSPQGVLNIHSNVTQGFAGTTETHLLQTSLAWKLLPLWAESYALVPFNSLWTLQREVNLFKHISNRNARYAPSVLTESYLHPLHSKLFFAWVQFNRSMAWRPSPQCLRFKQASPCLQTNPLIFWVSGHLPFGFLFWRICLSTHFYWKIK